MDVTALVSPFLQRNTSPQVNSSNFGQYIPVVGNIIDNLINRRNAVEQQTLQNKSNMELARYQYAQSVDMWNKANAYNTPAAQMQRFRDAGLNPNLIYSQGSAGNSPNVLPQYHAPEMRYNAPSGVNLSGAIAAYQDIALKKAQTDNIQAQVQNIKQETSNKAIDQALKVLGIQKAKAESPYWGINALWQSVNTQGSANRTLFGARLAEYQAEYQKVQNRFVDRILSQTFANLGATGANIAQNTAMNLVKTGMLQKENKLIYPRAILELVNAINPLMGLSRMLGVGANFLKE